MKRAIATVGIGKWYPRGVARLIDSAHNVQPDIDVVAWVNTLPPGSPTHQEAPYAFKAFAIDFLRKQGVKQVLWLDSAVSLHNGLNDFFEMLHQKGHYFEYNGAFVGEWCADSALDPLGITREQAMTIPELCGGCFGLDFSNQRPNDFLDELLGLAVDGAAFRGPWNNRDGEASADPRVKGHRHDQTAMSVLSARMGMEWHDPDHRLYVYPAYGTPKPEAIFYNRGM
jgi:hypothetical protein